MIPINRQSVVVIITLNSQFSILNWDKSHPN